jgi:hypothetical protein
VSSKNVFLSHLWGVSSSIVAQKQAYFKVAKSNVIIFVLFSGSRKGAKAQRFIKVGFYLELCGSAALRDFLF